MVSLSPGMTGKKGSQMKLNDFNPNLISKQEKNDKKI